jgi:mono/diheme cytochrome c family protein
VLSATRFGYIEGQIFTGSRRSLDRTERAAKGTMKFLNLVCSFGTALMLLVFVGGLVAQGNGATHKGDPVKGKEVFRVTACWRCHDVETGVSKRPPAPSLKGVYERGPHSLADGTRHEKHTDEMFRTIITEGTIAMNPRGAVLTDEELDDLLAYMHTL